MKTAEQMREFQQKAIHRRHTEALSNLRRSLKAIEGLCEAEARDGASGWCISSFCGYPESAIREVFEPLGYEVVFSDYCGWIIRWEEKA